MSGGTSQPNLNSIVEALRHTPRDTRTWTLTRSTSAPIIGRRCARITRPFDSGPQAGSARLYQHEIPGGQYTNLREQAAAMGLGHRWREVENTYAEVNQLFGDIVKVTPSSKVVGDMTLFLMAKEMKPAGPARSSTWITIWRCPIPSWKCFPGALGVPPGGWPKKLQRIILRGAGPRRAARAPALPAVDFAAEQAELREKSGPPGSPTTSC